MSSVTVVVIPFLAVLCVDVQAFAQRCGQGGRDHPREEQARGWLTPWLDLRRGHVG